MKEETQIIPRPMPTWVPCRYNCGRIVGLPPNMRIAAKGSILIPCKKCSKEREYYDTKIKGKP